LCDFLVATLAEKCQGVAIINGSIDDHSFFHRHSGDSALDIPPTFGDGEPMEGRVTEHVESRAEVRKTARAMDCGRHISQCEWQNCIGPQWDKQFCHAAYLEAAKDHFGEFADALSAPSAPANRLDDEEKR
jgi:hypothetical protein